MSQVDLATYSTYRHLKREAFVENKDMHCHLQTLFIKDKCNSHFASVSFITQATVFTIDVCYEGSTKLPYLQLILMLMHLNNCHISRLSSCTQLCFESGEPDTKKHLHKICSEAGSTITSFRLGCFDHYCAFILQLHLTL